MTVHTPPCQRPCGRDHRCRLGHRTGRRQGLAQLGLCVVLADLDGEKLSAAAQDVAALAEGGEADVVAIGTDVSRLDDLKPWSAPFCSASVACMC